MDAAVVKALSGVLPRAKAQAQNPLWEAHRSPIAPKQGFYKDLPPGPVKVTPLNHKKLKIFVDKLKKGHDTNPENVYRLMPYNRALILCF
jgi:hypothetical protein